MVAVALDELHRKVQVQQTRVLSHRPDHHIVYSCLPNILEYGLERGEVAMNVIDCGDPHDRPSNPPYLLLAQFKCARHAERP